MKSLNIIVVFLIFFAIGVSLLASIGYAIWNFAVVPAFNAPPASWLQVLVACIVLWFISSFFRRGSSNK